TCRRPNTVALMWRLSSRRPLPLTSSAPPASQKPDVEHRPSTLPMNRSGFDSDADARSRCRTPPAASPLPGTMDPTLGWMPSPVKTFRPKSSTLEIRSAVSMVSKIRHQLTLMPTTSLWSTLANHVWLDVPQLRPAASSFSEQVSALTVRLKPDKTVRRNTISTSGRRVMDALPPPDE